VPGVSDVSRLCRLRSLSQTFESDNIKSGGSCESVIGGGAGCTSGTGVGAGVGVEVAWEATVLSQEEEGVVGRCQRCVEGRLIWE
jgi:hypothetical protein